MRTLRLASVCVAVATATLASGAALAKDARPVGPPKNLRGFLLKPNEPVTRVFPRTPAFSWAPVRGAQCYEFELATSRSFSSNSVIWSNARDDAEAKSCRAVPADPGATTGTASDPSTDPATAPTTATGSPSTTPDVLQPLRVPAVSIDLVLPWFTGNPYALYARVRAVTSGGSTQWSKSFGFNMRWQSRPAPMASPQGMVRWSSVEGATGYQVWYPQIGKSFSTNTNTADERELYIFHRSDPTWWANVQWRVRAVRRVSGTIPNGLPSVSFGQWSPTYLAVNPTPSTGPLKLIEAISDHVSKPGNPKAHELMPSLVFSGDQGMDGRAYKYFRAYVSTDRDCVNIVFKGSVTGSPAFAPRTSGPLKLPATESDVAIFEARTYPHAISDDKTEPADVSWSADWRPLSASENLPASATEATTPEGPTDESKTVVQAKVDLPDIDFPSTRYYWTVVPVDFQANPTNDATSAKEKKGFVDIESPQDACQAGRVATFGKESAGVRTGNGAGTPFVSGLSPDGRFLNSTHPRPTVYSTPLVAWQPAIGATAYEVQWSKSRYPWRATGTVKTFATSAILVLPSGTWYYRIRGLNQTQMRRAEMAWSSPVAIKVAHPKFTISGG